MPMMPREKFERGGINSLTDAELLAAILGSGSSKADVLKISRDAICEIKKSRLSGKPFPEITKLTKISGIGSIRAITILCCLELGKRLNAIYQDIEKISSSESAYIKLKYLGAKKQENMVCIFLNARYEILSTRLIARGGINVIAVQIRDILVQALEQNSVSLILAHNHPSGDPTPSENDTEFTIKLERMCDFIGLKLLDHIVIGKDSWKRVELKHA